MEPPDHRVKSPCSECPFNRKVERGALGGSAVHVYVGQANGPFYLPCHKHTKFDDLNWKDNLGAPQCAGAAIFRANLGIADRFPAFILHLPEDRAKVFASFEEFVCHHTDANPYRVKMCLDELTPDYWTQEAIRVAHSKGSRMEPLKKSDNTA